MVSSLDRATSQQKKCSATKTTEQPKGKAYEVQRFVGHEAEVVDVAFSPDGQTAVSGGADARVFLWDVETGEVMERLDGHTARVTGVAFTPDGQKIVSSARH